jgi:hypothetical protein
MAAQLAGLAAALGLERDNLDGDVASAWTDLLWVTRRRWYYDEPRRLWRADTVWLDQRGIPFNVNWECGRIDYGKWSWFTVTPAVAARWRRGHENGTDAQGGSLSYRNNHTPPIPGIYCQEASRPLRSHPLRTHGSEFIVELLGKRGGFGTARFTAQVAAHTGKRPGAIAAFWKPAEGIFYRCLD